MPRWLILLFLLIFLFGCTRTVPGDFKLAYGFGSCNHSWSWTDAVVLANGIVTVNSGNAPEKSFGISYGELKAIYDEVEKSDFFSLQGKYENPNVIGGYCTKMEITSNGERKQVESFNAPVPAISKISEVLVAELNLRDSGWFKPTGSQAR